jgi:Domain of unknown function (DUF4276)
VKFVLFVEGATEHKALGGFLQRWLNPRLKQPVGIRLVGNLQGWSRFRIRLQRKICAELDAPGREDVIAALGLLDLYGPDFYPAGARTVHERYEWAVETIEREVGRDRFKMFFAVHETEAWLLNQAKVFPSEVRAKLEKLGKRPENVNFIQPPSKYIDEAYRSINRKYKKTVDGFDLFSKADPQVAYDACPHLKRLLDTMLDLARTALEPL